MRLLTIESNFMTKDVPVEKAVSVDLLCLFQLVLAVVGFTIIWNWPFPLRSLK